MSNNTKKFPNDFIWGASTSAFQVEGAYLTDGKGLSTIDIREVPEGIADSKIAADHYNNYKEDVKLMAELGLKAYRFSFCWSRIMPDGTGEPNEKGLQFYDNLIDELLKHGIEPLVTLYHFEMPQALVDNFGGWKSRECIDAYVKYAEICFKRYKGKVKKWATINEQLIASAASDLNGNHEPDSHKKLKNIYQMSYHMHLAEKKAIALLRDIDGDAMIGPVCAIQITYPKTSSPKDVYAAFVAEEMMMYYLLDMSVRGEYPKTFISQLRKNGLHPDTCEGDEAILKSSTPDYLGLNYYTTVCAKENTGEVDQRKIPPFFRSDLFEIVKNDEIPATEWMTLGINPDGLKLGIKKIYDRYNLPMMIMENGMAYTDEVADGKIHDEYRIDYLEKHINACYDAIEDGYPLIGYSPWSFIDVLSSHQGFKKRYGLVYIDRTDEDPKECARIKKDSFYWYQKVISNNSI